jgi:circadian clock protein KaiC
MGPAGVGKSTLATQYAVAAAKRGERAALFIFDENRRSLLKRSAAVGMDLAGPLEEGLITAQQVDPAELAPGEFANLVREAVEKNGARTIVIDSLNGYLNAMPEERFLTLHLHEMLTYLSDHGVATILVMAQHGLIGTNMISSVDVSYLADCVVLLRYYEADGELHKAISVMKKRSGDHEKAIREFSMGEGGLNVGPPLKHFRGILSGIPIVEEK